MYFRNFAFFLISISVISHAAGATAQQGQHMMHSRVPADKLEEARALRNPIPYTEETVAKGKALYEGKGTCVNCHGMNGGRGRHGMHGGMKRDHQRGAADECCQDFQESSNH